MENRHPEPRMDLEQILARPGDMWSQDEAHFAYKRIFEEEYVSFCRRAKRFVGQEAEDAVMCVFVNTFSANCRYRTYLGGGRIRFIAWMNSCVIRQCLTIIRNINQRPTERIDDVDLAEPEQETDNFSFTYGEVNRAIKELDEKSRDLICLIAYGFSYKEIAIKMGMPKNNVSMRVSRARQALQAKLKNIYGSDRWTARRTFRNPGR